MAVSRVDRRKSASRKLTTELNISKNAATLSRLEKTPPRRTVDTVPIYGINTRSGVPVIGVAHCAFGGSLEKLVCCTILGGQKTHETVSSYGDMSRSSRSLYEVSTVGKQTIIISPMVIVTYRNFETWSYNRKRTLLFCDLPNLPSTLRQPDMDCRTVQTTVKEILVCLGPRRTNYFLFLMHRV